MEITAKETLPPDNNLSLTLPDFFSLFFIPMFPKLCVTTGQMGRALTFCDSHKKIDLTSTVIIVIVLGAKVSEERNQ